jgi:nucleolar GTP-binding protein
MATVLYDNIPTILDSQEILDKILGRSTRIQKTDRRRDRRFKKTAEARTEAMRDLLVGTLDRYVKSFPNLDRVDTYEHELVEILIGIDPLRQALGRLSGASQAARRWCDEAQRQVRRTRDQDEIKRVRRRLIGRLSELVEDLEQPLAVLADARRRFQQVPAVTPGDITVVVAGYPNVGKSSLVAALSGARPEIAPYAFTTKQVNVGHFLEPGKDDLHARRFQLVDTPGLLEKPPAERNGIEKQAALALTHLADLILFTVDPTETCGYTLDQQERLLTAITEEFRGIPMILVETKHDLEQSPPPTDRLRVSCTTGHGIEDLRRLIIANVPSDTFAQRLAAEQAPRWAEPDARGPDA